jgi:hypothetical protein
MEYMSDSISRTVVGLSDRRLKKSSRRGSESRRPAVAKLTRVPTVPSSQRDAQSIERTMPIELHWLDLTTSGGDFAFETSDPK